jgi:predicted ATPase
MLLVLDNCEHVLAVCADLVRQLLQRCPRLVVLATSREMLGVRGERLVAVGSLGLPVGEDAGSVAVSAAGALFVARAGAVRPGFALNDANAAAVAAVCRRLDGLPLAIELAAARVRVLSPTQIAGHLDDAFGVLGNHRDATTRHQTLDAALGWSFDLLLERERTLFRRLAVFRGGFTLATAKAVGADTDGHGLEVSDVLEVLTNVIDKSLVAVADGPDDTRRYFMLEVVRQFATRRLEEAGESNQIHRRHRDQLTVTLQAGPRFAGSGASLLQVAEIDNVRAALTWSLQNNEPEEALRLAVRYPYWQDLGLLAEHVEVLLRVLEAAHWTATSLTDLAAAHEQAALELMYLGELDRASANIGRLGALVELHPDRDTLRGRWLYTLAAFESYRRDGDLVRARSIFLECQACFDTAGRPNPYPACEQALEAALSELDDQGWQNTIANDGIERARLADAPWAEMTIKHSDAFFRFTAGDSAALKECDDLVDQQRRSGSTWLLEFCVMCAGIAHEMVGDMAAAGRAAGSFLRFCRGLGYRQQLPTAVRNAARVIAHAGQHAEAVRLLGAAEALDDTIGLRSFRLLDRLEKPYRQAYAAALGAELIERLLAEGRTWSAAQAAEAALFALDPP